MFELVSERNSEEEQSEERYEQCFRAEVLEGQAQRTAENYKAVNVTKAQSPVGGMRLRGRRSPEHAVPPRESVHFIPACWDLVFVTAVTKCSARWRIHLGLTCLHLLRWLIRVWKAPASAMAPGDHVSHVCSDPSNFKRT